MLSTVKLENNKPDCGKGMGVWGLSQHLHYRREKDEAENFFKGMITLKNPLILATKLCVSGNENASTGRPKLSAQMMRNVQHRMNCRGSRVKIVWDSAQTESVICTRASYQAEEAYAS